MNQGSIRRLLPLAALLLLCWFLFFRGLAERDLSSSHEARAAMDAQDLLDDGFAAVPRLFDGRAELQKPPLYYWLVALAARATGSAVGAGSVRLPAALAGLGGVLLLYGFGVRRGRPVAGLAAATVLATALHYTWLARVGRIDMPLTLTTAAAVLGICGRASRLGRVVAYLALAAGLLLKGPIGAVLPLGVVGAWLLVNRELPPPWRPRPWLGLLYRYGVWWGVPLVALLVAPVYWWANARTGGAFVQVFLWHHNVERGFGGSDLLRAHPWWFYAPHLAADFLPWSPLLPVAAWAFVRRGWWRDDPEARLGLTWLLAVTLLLSLARFKRADYLLPAFPGAALFLGCAAERWYRGAAHPRRLAAAFAALALACAASWGLYLAHDLRRNEPARTSVPFAESVRRLAPAPRPILFFRTEAHAAAFHVGRPLAVFVEWENLDAWAAGPEPVYVVMPERVAREWPRSLKTGRLVEVMREPAAPAADLPAWLSRGLPPRLGRDLARFLAGEGHDRPLVLLRTVPRSLSPP
jgi:4-amino-4-deoxy-L-arabinose transferase-like glycosyltransferase